jgi:putative phage-type endonuclease
MKIYEMEQRSPEWYEVRKAKFTASDANTIMAMGKGLETLITKKLAEYFSTGNFEDFSCRFTNKNIERGVDFEDKARSIYELETGSTVRQVGFVEANDYLGCSPDGLVDDDGLIEIKNHNDEVFLRLCEEHKIEKKYYDQMQMQMYVTGRKWCDYFGFNPNFSPCYVRIRVPADISAFERLDEAMPHAIASFERRKMTLEKYLERI